MPVRQAMLMAAGLGTRLRPFTDLEPKALLPLLGIPIAQFAMDAIRHAGVERVIANVHHLAERSREGLRALDIGSTELIVSDESAELLGSAGGLRKALPHFGGEPFFLVNADVLSDVDLRALARTHERSRAQWGASMTLAVFRRPTSPGKYREILLDEDAGLVRGFSQDLKEDRPFFIGAAVLEPEALRDVPMHGPAEFVPAILEPRVRERKVAFHLAAGIWKDIGSPGLWLDSHLFLIRALETGRLPVMWRQRLDRENVRIADGVWASRKSGRLRAGSGWAGPCYFAGQNPPLEFGPNAVLYGAAPAGAVLANGIGFGGQWVRSSHHVAEDTGSALI